MNIPEQNKDTPTPDPIPPSDSSEPFPSVAQDPPFIPYRKPGANPSRVQMSTEPSTKLATASLILGSRLFGAFCGKYYLFPFFLFLSSRPRFSFHLPQSLLSHLGLRIAFPGLRYDFQTEISILSPQFPRAAEQFHRHDTCYYLLWNLRRRYGSAFYFDGVPCLLFLLVHHFAVRNKRYKKSQRLFGALTPSSPLGFFIHVVLMLVPAGPQFAVPNLWRPAPSRFLPGTPFCAGQRGLEAVLRCSASPRAGWCPPECADSSPQREGPKIPKPPAGCRCPRFPVW